MSLGEAIDGGRADAVRLSGLIVAVPFTFLDPVNCFFPLPLLVGVLLAGVLLAGVLLLVGVL